MGFPATPALTVDCVVVDAEDRVLLIRRRNPPFKGHFAFPGGFVDVGESVEDACRRELREETHVRAGKLSLLGVYSDPARDPRGHTCSVAFLTRVGHTTARAGDDAAAVEWVALAGRPRMAFDHGKILQDARRMLRQMKKGHSA